MALYDKQRITSGRVANYLLDKFKDYETVTSVKNHIIEVTPFQQSNFGA